MGVNSLPKTVTRQRRGRDLNPGLSAPESSTLTTRLPSNPMYMYDTKMFVMCWQTTKSGGVVHSKHRSVDVSQQTQILEPSARHRVVFLQRNTTARFTEAFSSFHTDVNNNNNTDFVEQSNL